MHAEDVHGEVRDIDIRGISGVIKQVMSIYGLSCNSEEENICPFNEDNVALWAFFKFNKVFIFLSNIFTLD